MLSRCFEAADLLAVEGIEARVIEVHTIKPLDDATIVAAARETGALVTAEEHSVVGGLGGAVLEALAATSPVPVERIGLADTFAASGPYEALLEHLGLTARAIADAAHRAIDHKGAPPAPASRP
jgi:transketolase